MTGLKEMLENGGFTKVKRQHRGAYSGVYKGVRYKGLQIDEDGDVIFSKAIDLETGKEAYEI